MPPRDQYDWLNADDGEEDDDHDYDFSREQDSKDIVFNGRSLKRRKLNDNSDDESIATEDERQDQVESSRGSRGSRVPRLAKANPKSNVVSLVAQEDDDSSPRRLLGNISSQAPPALASKRLESKRRKVKKTGVVYLTRIPPFMKPATVKHLLQPYGEIGRIFLTPEDSQSHARRVKAGGNKKRSFIDGWVEFSSKKDAKLVAETLNATIIGGKKGGWYHDDVWNIKYLKGFRWHHLTEQIANENAERAARLRTEIAQTTRENKAFLQNVERAKMLDGMEAKKNRRREGLDSDTMNDDMGTSDPPKTKYEKSISREFKQNEAMLKTRDNYQTEEPSDHVKRVLGKIF